MVIIGRLERFNEECDFYKLFLKVLTNIYNHEAHHRGMILLYLEILGKENDYIYTVQKLGYYTTYCLFTIYFLN
jgi:hypothetical protein